MSSAVFLWGFEKLEWTPPVRLVLLDLCGLDWLVRFGSSCSFRAVLPHQPLLRRTKAADATAPAR